MEGKNRKALISKADKLMSELVSKRVTCQKCGKLGCDPHHIESRDYMNLRYCPDNFLWLCRLCHDWFGSHPKDSEEWLKLNFPIQYAWLQWEKNHLVYDLGTRIDGVIEELKNKLKGL